MANSAVAGLLPVSDNIELLSDIPLTADYTLEVTSVFSKYVYTHHMRQGYYPFLDLDIPASVPAVDLNFAPDSNLGYDLLISPFSMSDCDHNKKWFDDRWGELLQLLPANMRVCIVGSRSDETSETAARVRLASKEARLDFVEQYGRSLHDLMGIIKNARLALTLDNGISHAVSLLGVPHVLLYPACLPICWVTNPNSNALVHQEDPRNLQVDTVFKLLDRVAFKPTAPQ